MAPQFFSYCQTPVRKSPNGVTEKATPLPLGLLVLIETLHLIATICVRIEDELL